MFVQYNLRLLTILQFPSNLLLQRWKMGRTLSLCMIIWGIIVLCIGFGSSLKSRVT